MTLNSKGEIKVERSEILWVIEEKDEMRYWMHQAHGYLKTIKPKCEFNSCSPKSLSHYVDTFDRILLFLHDSKHILEYLLEDDKYKNILKNEHKALVILQTDDNGPLTDESLNNMNNVKIVQDFRNIVQWWPHVLSFLYSDYNTSRETNESDNNHIVIYDAESREDTKVAETVQKTLSDLGVSFSVQITGQIETRPTTQTRQGDVYIICGSTVQTQRMFDQIKQNKRKNVSYFVVNADNVLPSFYEQSTSCSADFRCNVNDFKLWKDILVALNIINFSIMHDTCAEQLFVKALPKLSKALCLVLTAFSDVLFDLYILVNLVAWFLILTVFVLVVIVIVFPFLPIRDKAARSLCPESLLRYSYRTVAFVHLAAVISGVVLFGIFNDVEFVRIIFYAYVVPFMSVTILRSMLSLLPSWYKRNVVKDFFWINSPRDAFPGETLHYWPLVRRCCSKLYIGSLR